MKKTKKINKQLRKSRIRARIYGTALRPRLSVFRGLKSMFVQLIDDDLGVTLASVSEKELPRGMKEKTKSERAKALGGMLAEKAKKMNISCAVFDRGGNAYHGRVRAVAEGARESGLQF